MKKFLLSVCRGVCIIILAPIILGSGSILFVLIAGAVIGIISSLIPNPVVASLPAYTDQAYYTSGGFQDFTDYAKYSYEAVTTQDLESSAYLRKVTAADIDELLQYVDNFENWVGVVGDELEPYYDFSSSMISEKDYFYLDSKYANSSKFPDTPDERKKFWSYNLYFFDIETQTLYFFHNNI